MKWVVEFDGEDPGPSDDFVFEFTKIKSVVSDPSIYKISKNFVNNLTMLISSKKNYSIIGNIKKIISPDGTEYTDKAIYALIGFIMFKDTKLQVGFLLAEYSDNTFGLLGIWPDEFVRVVEQDNPLLTNFLQLIVNAPEKWNSVYLVVPIKFASRSNGPNKINQL